VGSNPTGGLTILKMDKTKFQRAVFLSWYCSLGDCKFCYMSTQKNKIKDPKKAKRSLESVLAEVLICKKLGWGLEFVSAGYGVFEFDELLKYLQAIKTVWGKKIWLNIGYLDENQIKKLLPLIEGISVSIETTNWKLRKQLCPSKPLEPMVKTLELADRYNLKKSMTLILGLGEKRTDIQELKIFIKKYQMDRITIYRLKPQKETIFENKKELDTKDYTFWVKEIRDEFPNLKIIVGSWIDHLNELNLLLKNGANDITKFPSIKMFANKYAQQIESEIKQSGRLFEGSLTKMPKIDWEKEVENHNLNKEVFTKISKYLKTMEKNINQNK
jgi:biotin synthase-like enzyme